MARLLNPLDLALTKHINHSRPTLGQRPEMIVVEIMELQYITLDFSGLFVSGGFRQYCLLGE